MFTITGPMAQHSDNEEKEENPVLVIFFKREIKVFQEINDQSCVQCWTVVAVLCYLDVYLCLVSFLESHSCATEVEQIMNHFLPCYHGVQHRNHL